jgi:hypothetical protein
MEQVSASVKQGIDTIPIPTIHVAKRILAHRLYQMRQGGAEERRHV